MRSRVIEIASTISGKTKMVDDEFYPIWEGRNPLSKVNASTVTPGPPRETHSLYKISYFDIEVGQEARHQRIQGRQTRLPGRLPHADGLVALICLQEKVWSTRTCSTCLRRTIRCRIPGDRHDGVRGQHRAPPPRTGARHVDPPSQSGPSDDGRRDQGVAREEVAGWLCVS